MMTPLTAVVTSVAKLLGSVITLVGRLALFSLAVTAEGAVTWVSGRRHRSTLRARFEGYAKEAAKGGAKGQVAGQAAGQGVTGDLSDRNGVVPVRRGDARANFGQFRRSTDAGADSTDGLPSRCRGRVAVIGAGIAGSGAAWALGEDGFDVEVFEAASWVGGNAKTVMWPDGQRTGLSVLAWPAALLRNYTALLRRLGDAHTEVECDCIKPALLHVNGPCYAVNAADIYTGSGKHCMTCAPCS